MKTKAAVLAGILMLGFHAKSQEEEVSQDTTKIEIGNATVVFSTENDRECGEDILDTDDYFVQDAANWVGIDVGVTMLTDGSFGTSFPNSTYLENDPAQSFSWNFNLLEHRFKLAGPYLGITTGIGFNVGSIGLKNNYKLISEIDTMYAEVDTTWNYTKNKLTVGYFQIPLLIDINTSKFKKKHFHISLGVIGGVRIGSHIKRKASQGGERYRVKEQGTFHLNPFKADATIRLGYRNWGIYANYNLIPLFDTKVVDKVHAITFGVSVTI